MPIYLDDEPAEIAGQTLGQVIDAAHEGLQRAGRAVVEVKLDGRALLGEDLDARRADPIAAHEVRLYSAVTRDLAVLTLEGVREALQEARAAQRDAADLFQQDKPADAMRRVGDAIHIWQLTQQAVIDSTKLFGLDLDQRLFEDRPISALTDEFLARFKTLRDLIGAGDTVGLADSLLYEWPELTDRWDRLIAALIGWVKAV